MREKLFWVSQIINELKKDELWASLRCFYLSVSRGHAILTDSLIYLIFCCSLLVSFLYFTQLNGDVVCCRSARRCDDDGKKGNRKNRNLFSTPQSRSVFCSVGCKFFMNFLLCFFRFSEIEWVTFYLFWESKN